MWRIDKLGDKPRRTWKQATVKWLIESTHKKTLDTDKLYLKWVDPFLGHLYLDEITRDVIEVISEKKLATGVKPATVNRHLEIVRMILNKSCREWEWLDRVPFIRMLKEPKRRIRWLTHAEAQTLLSKLPSHLATMMTFSLATGLREANVTHLEWSQVNLERRVAWIHADQAKAGKPIGVPLNNEVVILLRQQIGKHETRVFTYLDKPVNKCNTKAWRNALVKAGIKDFRWHDLRHTWASWHVQNGTPIHVLQELGGWSDIRMVQRYAHLAPEHLSKYADSLCELKTVDATLLATPESEHKKSS